MQNDVPEIYIYRRQTGFNAFDSGLIVGVPGHVLYSHDTYKGVAEFSLSNIINGLGAFYNGMLSVEVNCDGKLRKLSSLEHYDGYFGRPKLTFVEKFFTRRLRPGEIKLLQKRIDEEKNYSSLDIKLLSSRI